MNRFLIGIIFVFNILILSIPSYAAISLESFSKNNDIHCTKMISSFKELLLQSGNPGGLVIIPNSCDENLIAPEPTFSTVSLDENLKLLTQNNSNYTWKKNSNVINLLPVSIMPDILNVKIQEFKADNINNLTLTLDSILKMPEVTKKKTETKIKEGIYFGGLTSPPSKKEPIRMTFQNKTLHEILNEIVSKRNRGIWLYREYNYNNEKYFTLEFIAQ